MSDIIKVGQRAGEWVLVVISPGTGTFISLDTFNRWSDYPVEVEYNRISGPLVKVDENNKGKIPPAYFQEENEQKEESCIIRTFRHLRPRSNPNLRGVTFAIDLDYNKNQIRFGIAMCNGDNFVKSIGRGLAQGQLVSSPRIIQLSSLTSILKNDCIVLLIGEYLFSYEKKLYKKIDVLLGYSK